MTTRTLLSLGLSALVLGGATVGCAGGGGGIASAGSRATVDGDAAAKRAAKAVARHDPEAVSLAEAAVAALPNRVEARLLLGQGYLQAGRFASARDAFGDALRLAPDNGRAALNLALAQIATGDWRAARTTLDAHRDGIAPSDRGLALALAGDPAGGVALLMQTARQPGADVKVRQNLGLALALGGEWSMARAVAAADLSPADLDARMREWATFAQPTAASDQVATLLGVRAVADAGQPVTLALTAPAPAAPATAAEMVAAVPDASRVVVPMPVATARPMLSASAITFAPRREVVQALPVPMLRAEVATKVALAPVRGPARSGAARSRAPLAGEWHVQLGAFENAAVARDAWSRLSHRHAVLEGRRPQGAAFRAGGGTVYRLSLGGFDRGAADGMCREVRARGGACFVRRAAGDQVAQWLRPGVQIAAR